MPASSIASRMDVSGGTVRVSSLWARWTSNASCSTGSGFGEWFGDEPLDVQ